MSKNLVKTNILESQKNGNRNNNSQINFINQVPSGNKKNNELGNAANKLSGIAKLAKINALEAKNAKEGLEQFINNVTQLNVPIKELSVVKKVLYNKNDLEMEEANFNLYKSSLKDTNCTESDVRKQAICDTVYFSWQNLETICNNFPKEIFSMAENLKLIKKDNDGTDNLTEEYWRALLGLNYNKTIQIQICTDIKKEKIDDDKEMDLDGKDELAEDIKKDNNKLSEEDKKLKKTLVEKFKGKRKEKNNEIINVIDTLNGSLKNSNNLVNLLMQQVNEDVIPNMTDKSTELWNKIQNLKPVMSNIHVDNVIQTGKAAAGKGNFSDSGMILKISYALLSLSNRLNNVILCINSLKESINYLYNKDIEIAKGGSKTWNNINKRIIFNYNLAKGNVKFVEKDKWVKLSFFEKVKNNFKFSDYNQMPDRRIWKKFSDKEKEEFLSSKCEFRNKRIMEIAKIDNEVERSTVLDKFIYYMWKDRFGFDCFVKKELKDKFNDSEDNSTIINGFYEKCLELEQKKLLYNVFFLNGLRRFTNGRTINSVVDWVNDKSIKNKYKRKNKSSFKFSPFNINRVKNRRPFKKISQNKGNKFLGKKLNREEIEYNNFSDNNLELDEDKNF